MLKTLCIIRDTKLQRVYLYENMQLFALDYGWILGRVVVENSHWRRMENPGEMENGHSSNKELEILHLEHQQEIISNTWNVSLNVFSK